MSSLSLVPWRGDHPGVGSVYISCLRYLVSILGLTISSLEGVITIAGDSVAESPHLNLQAQGREPEPHGPL